MKTKRKEAEEMRCSALLKGQETGIQSGNAGSIPLRSTKLRFYSKILLVEIICAMVPICVHAIKAKNYNQTAVQKLSYSSMAEQRSYTSEVVGSLPAKTTYCFIA